MQHLFNRGLQALILKDRVNTQHMTFPSFSIIMFDRHSLPTDPYRLLISTKNKTALSYLLFILNTTIISR